MLRIYLRRRVHISWLVAVCSSAIFVGVILARFIPSSLCGSIAWLLTGIGLVVGVSMHRKVWMLVLIIVGGIYIGLWRGSIEQMDLSTYTQLYDRVVVISGRVADDVETNKRGQTIIRLTDIRVKKTELKGAVWVVGSTKKPVQRSDRLVVSGKFEKGFGTFAGLMYNANVLSRFRPEQPDIALNVRNWFASKIAAATNEPQTSLGLGYLLGQRRGLPEELDTALKAAGLTHVVVASGYNLTILVRLARRLFEKISKYLSFLAASSMILSFIAITGMSPSMSRAGLVAGLSLVAWYYGRRFHPLVLLPLAVAVTVMINPSYAWGDLGWQLSFAAFAGVMLLAPLANAYFIGDKAERPIVRILIETLAAQLCTLPIILLTFGQISVVAPLANLLILPLVPLAMLLTFIAGIGVMIVPSAAIIIGLPAELLLSYMTQTIRYVGELPWALQHLQLSWLGATFMYVAIVLLGIYMWHKTKLDLAKTSLVE